jgi:polyhydroxybutyrate depolymerase
MKSITLLLTLFSTSAFAQNSQNADCQLDIPCELDSGRSYHIKVPDDWDGKTQLLVLMHFHGWQRTGALPVQHDRNLGATHRRG